MDKIPEKKIEHTPEQKQLGSKINNTEWGLVIGAMIVTDLLQLGLDLILIGAVVNRLLDIFVGMCLAFYFWVRGIKMDQKKMLALLGSFVGEEIPAFDALPLWTADVIVTMLLDKADKKIGGVPLVGKTLQKTIQKIPKNPL